MRSLFRAFDRAGVRYLLISGQACVAYGAAEFSEDVDLWVEPAAKNLRRTLQALASLGARVYKLTPPLAPAHARRGHGFHFTIGDAPAGRMYVDLLGQPPRVGSFAAAARAATRLRFEGGSIPTVSIPHLAEMKKTRRLSDYETISNLMRVHVEASRRPGPRLVEWALRHSFRVEDHAWLLERFSPSAGLLRRVQRPSLEVSPADFARCAEAINREIVPLQDADVRYWSPRIEELRRLRRRSKLWVEGTPVASRIR